MKGRIWSTMSVCGKCEATIELDTNIYDCPDCGTQFHHDCQNLDSGVCPVCAICGIAPIKTIERKKVELSFQRKGVKPSGEQLGFEKIVVENSVNEQFESAPIEKQVELINKAIKAKPRKFVQSKGTLKNKHIYLAVLAVIVMGIIRAGFESGHWYPFLIAGVVAAGAGIWWVTS
jgi:hypothetical protein